MVIGGLSAEELPGPEGRNTKLMRQIADVNSTFSDDASWSPFSHFGKVLYENKKADLKNQTGLLILIPATTYVPTQLPVQYHRPGEA